MFCSCGRRLLANALPKSTGLRFLTTSSCAVLQDGGQSQGRVPQKRSLSAREEQIFKEILGNLRPTSDSSLTGSTSTSTTKSDGFHEQLLDVSRMLNERAGGRRLRKKLAQEPLTPEQELELDRLREDLMAVPTDYELVKWAMKNVFGLESSSIMLDSLPSDAAGPRSPFYAELLLSLFVTLRDSHRSPQLALHIFSLACTSIESFIRGCTNALWEQVLKTHWVHGGGDVELVVRHVETMIATGLRADKAVSLLTEEIGQAIKRDHELARASSATVSPPVDGKASVQETRFFSEAQIGAWRQLEVILERQKEERERALVRQQNEKWSEWALRKADEGLEEAKRVNEERPNLFFDVGRDEGERQREDAGPILSWGYRRRHSGNVRVGRSSDRRPLAVGESKYERSDRYRPGTWPRADNASNDGDARDTQTVNASWMSFFDSVEKEKMRPYTRSKKASSNET